MAVNKNFVVKNGLEVDTNLILADATSNKVGIGTSIPQYPLHVFGGIGVTDSYVAGVSTIRNELNVGTGGTIFTVIATETENQFVGIRTANPAFLLDIRSPVSTGQTALYVQGDARITGSTNIEGDISIDEVNIRNLNVSGVSTFVGFATFRESVGIQTDLNVGGISTFVGVATFKSDLYVGGDLYIRENITLDTNLYILGIATIGNLNIAGLTTTRDLEVTGFSTFVGLSTFRDSVYVQDNLQVAGITTLASSGGITTTGGDLYVGNNLYVNNDFVFDEATARNLDITGIGTFSTLNVGFGGTVLSVSDQGTFSIGSGTTVVTATLNGGTIPTLGLVIALSS